MAVTITIGGTDRTAFWLRERVSFELITNGRGKASSLVFDVPVGNAFRPQDGQVAVISEDGNVRYRGILLEPEEERIGDGDDNDVIRFECSASDYNIIADRRVVAATYENLPFEDIVDDIVTTALSGEGITQTNVETGETITKVTFNYITVTEAFNVLSEMTGKAWFIDADKDLNFKALTSVAAPADLDGAMALRGTVKVRPDRQKYRNRQYVLAGNELIPIVAAEEDATEQSARAALEGTSGIYEKVTQAEDITSGEVASEYAADLVARFSEVPKIIELDTRTAGYAAGQSATADFPEHDVNSVACFIEEVTGYINEELDEVWYNIRATTGDPFGEWMEHFRKDERHKPPLQISKPTPGAFDLVEIKPGAVVHDPPPGAGEFFQGALSDTLEAAISAHNITHHEDADGTTSGATYLVLNRGPVATPRQSILRLYPLDVNEKPASTAALTISWDELHGSSFKHSLCVSPDNRYVAFVERDSGGGDPVLGIVDLEGQVLRGNVALTGGADNNNGVEAWWAGNHIYWPGQLNGDLYVVDATDPDNPTLAATLSTSLTNCVSVVGNSTDTALYATGTGSQLVVSIDISTPGSPVEDDTVITVGNYASLDINDDDNRLGMAARKNSSTVSVARIELSGTTLSGLDEDDVPLSTTVMEGLAAIFAGDTLVVASEQPQSVANSFKVHAFNIEESVAASFVETFSFNHGTVGNVRPFSSPRGRRMVVGFDFQEAQVVYGIVTYPDVVPLSIDRPLRAGFGGTGISRYNTGDTLYAGETLPTDGRYNGALSRLPIGNELDVYIVSGELPAWHSFSGLLDFYGAVLPGEGAVDQLITWSGGPQWSAVSQVLAPYVPTYIDGLESTTAADSAHDVTLAAGVAADTLQGTGAPYRHAAATTKQIDASWAAGDAAGGLFSGTVASDTEYHQILIVNDSTGAVDWGWDTDAGGANAPSGWTPVRRLRSHFTDGSANIRGTRQYGDFIFYDVPPLDVNDSTGTLGTFETQTLANAPDDALVYLVIKGNATGVSRVFINLRQTGTSSVLQVAGNRADGSGATLAEVQVPIARFPLSSSKQIDIALTTGGAGGSYGLVQMQIAGWHDRRGR